MTDQLAERELARDDGAVTSPTTDPAPTTWRQRRRARRIAHWTRPPDPHDWRFFVGGLGRILITTGLLMFGFVGYQLWGTGIQTARAQSDLRSQFLEAVAANTGAGQLDAIDELDSVVGTTEQLTPADGPDTATTDGVTPDGVTTGGVGAETGAVPSGAGDQQPPPVPGAPARGPELVPVEQDIPAIADGTAIALLEIPKIGKVGNDGMVVTPGVSLDNLKNGPGHYPDTPLPGQLGNASIAGHRTTHGAPFAQVDELVPGDEIIVTMFTGDRYVYQVTGSQIVSPADSWVIGTDDPTIAELTLTSCHPEYTARDRIAVHAVLVPEKSARVGVPTFYELESVRDSTATAVESSSGGDPAQSLAPAADDDEGDLSAGVPDAAPDASSEVGTVEPGDVAADATADQPIDAFAEGWFHDSAAWPHIAAWGAALIALALASRRISRRFMRHAAGIAVGLVPFVVCLYFFYENVNRLLPPGL